MKQTLRQFLATEAAGGVLLLAAALLALIAANGPFTPYYESFLHMPIGVRAGDLAFRFSMEHIINDGLMTLFFLIIGLEVKREFMEGELSRPGQLLLPLAGALGGVVTPALIFLFFNYNTPEARGWAIPTATDIAFSLGVLALFGHRIPVALKIFLMALAVIDDILAVLIIALFYTSSLDLSMAFGALGIAVLIAALGIIRVRWLMPYMLLGFVMWFLVLQSGVHATVAGVVLGLLIPLRVHGVSGAPLSHVLEEKLHSWVAFIIMPLFAFANAGVSVEGLTVANMLHPLTIGIALGLFCGKQIGIAGLCFIVTRMCSVRLPGGAGWPAFYGVCMLAGIGFTMSLFIGMLAFPEAAMQLEYTRLGVLTGTLMSAICGYIVLSLSLRRSAF